MSSLSPRFSHAPVPQAPRANEPFSSLPRHCGSPQSLMASDIERLERMGMRHRHSRGHALHTDERPCSPLPACPPSSTSRRSPAHGGRLPGLVRIRSHPAMALLFLPCLPQPHSLPPSL